eukprot:scaffold1942_cov197-Alexandrium_tamarense.AAC.16
MSHNRQQSRDLPVIHEVATPQEIDDDEDDTASRGSYAFTLDGVGFDEESGSIMHTPPSLMTPSRIHKHEVELHRQTCRQLGIPLEDRAPMSAGSSSRESDYSSRESDYTSASSSSGTASARPDGPKETSWPWPTKDNEEMYDVPLENLENKQSDSSSSTKKRIGNINIRGRKKFKRHMVTRAKIAEMTSVYTNRMKEAVGSFSNKSKESYERSKEAYESSKRKRITDGTDVNTIIKRKLNVNDFEELCPEWYRNANPLMKLTMGTGLFFLMLCIIVVACVVGASTSGAASSGSLEEHGAAANVVNVNDPFAGLAAVNTTAIANDIGVAKNDVSESSTPTYMPSYTPTQSPFSVSLALPDGKSCVDASGKFETSRGKSRTCQWLTKRFDAECGGNGNEPSELGRNCRYACREYNGCGDGGGGGGGGGEGGGGETTDVQIEMVQPVQEKELETMQPSVSPTTNKPTSEPVQAEQDAVEEDAVDENTFVDQNGRERSCSWLDIRNWTQRKNRREANCKKITVQLFCPHSCSDFSTILINGARTDVPQLTRIHDPVPQDECYDGSGYYLNEHDHPRQCSWLNGSSDPADAITRRERNCGTSVEYPDATDLGKMCKNTCGTCRY